MPACLVAVLAVDNFVLAVPSDHVSASSCCMDGCVTTELASVIDLTMTVTTPDQESHNVRQLLT